MGFFQRGRAVLLGDEVQVDETDTSDGLIRISEELRQENRRPGKTKISVNR